MAIYQHYAPHLWPSNNREHGEHYGQTQVSQFPKTDQHIFSTPGVFVCFLGYWYIYIYIYIGCTWISNDSCIMVWYEMVPPGQLPCAV